MPRFDGTGKTGQGPGTGHGLGRCNTSNTVKGRANDGKACGARRKQGRKDGFGLKFRSGNE
ncbi:MAG: DUF5320 domain-containing protein [Carboxylicivirga sp.]|jgi:hypothetical protein|nr:DUF5320 domain-containing protein [Carboxylicivirga sp.]